SIGVGDQGQPGDVLLEVLEDRVAPVRVCSGSGRARLLPSRALPSALRHEWLGRSLALPRFSLPEPTLSHGRPPLAGPSPVGVRAGPAPACEARPPRLFAPPPTCGAGADEPRANRCGRAPPGAPGTH